MDLIIRRHDFDIAPRLATLDQSARRLSGHLTVPRDRPGQSDRSRNCGAQRPQEHSLRPVSQRKRIWPVSKIVKHPLEPLPRIGLNAQNGEVAEWSKAHAWKVCRRGTVSRVRIPIDPPLAHSKPDMRSLTGPLFFLFQRGLARPSDFWRLAVWPKSVSERPASLSIRPSSKSRRSQKVTPFPMLAENGLRLS